MKIVINIPDTVMDDWAGDILSGSVDCTEKTPAEQQVLAIVADTIMNDLPRISVRRRSTLVPTGDET